MVRPHAPPETEDAAADAPVCLDQLERNGATRFGGVVAKVEVTMLDGRVVSIDLPTPTPPAKDWTRTKTGRAILDVLAREGRGLKGQTVAKLADLEYSGSFRQTLKGLVAAGEVTSEDGEYSLAD